MTPQLPLPLKKYARRTLEAMIHELIKELAAQPTTRPFEWFAKTDTDNKTCEFPAAPNTMCAKKAVHVCVICSKFYCVEHRFPDRNPPLVPENNTERTAR